MIHRKQNLFITTVLLIMAGVLSTLAIWQFFTEPVSGGNDFLARVTAWEAHFKYGYSPYSDEAALFTQNYFYGGPAPEGGDQDRLTYPYYSVLVHGPFVYLHNYELARAVFITLSLAALMAGVLLSLYLVGWKPKPWLLAGLLLWCVLDYHQLRGLILGQYAIIGYFSLALTIYLLKCQKDGWAGVALTLSSVKPTLVFLVIPYLLLWAVSRRRWRFLYGFGLTMLGLFAGSFLMLPSWLTEWLVRVWRYQEYTVGQNPVWLLTHSAFPVLGTAWEVGLSVLLVAGMFITWWLALRPGGERRFYWALSVTLVVSSLIVPRSATTNYVMMGITAMWVFAALDRVPGWGRPTLIGLWLVSLVGMWWLHFSTVIGNQEQPIMYLPVPLASGLVLIFGYNWLMRDTRHLKLLEQE